MISWTWGLVAVQAPSFTSTGSVVIDPKGENLARAQQREPGGMPDTSAVDTQVEILRSRALAESVVRRLKLWNDPEFNPSMKPRLFGLGPAPAPIDQPNADLVARRRAEIDAVAP